MAFEFLDQPAKRRFGSDWDRLNLICIDHEHLPVLLAHMGFAPVAALPPPDWFSGACGDVILLVRDGDALYLDSWTGVWRDLNNACRGRDLASLAAFAWRCEYVRAAQRLAQLCGLERVPQHGG